MSETGEDRRAKDEESKEQGARSQRRRRGLRQKLKLGNAETALRGVEWVVFDFKSAFGALFTG
jgi:hypothetical protein